MNKIKFAVSLLCLMVAAQASASIKISAIKNAQYVCLTDDHSNTSRLLINLKGKKAWIVTGDERGGIEMNTDLASNGSCNTTALMAVADTKSTAINFDQPDMTGEMTGCTTDRWFALKLTNFHGETFQMTCYKISSRN